MITMLQLKKDLPKKVPWSKLEFFDRSEFRLNTVEENVEKNLESGKGFFKIIVSSVKAKAGYSRPDTKHVAIVYVLTDQYAINRIDYRLNDKHYVIHAVRHDLYIGHTERSEGYRFLREAEFVVDILNNQMIEKIRVPSISCEQFLFKVYEETLRQVVNYKEYDDIVFWTQPEHNCMGLSVAVGEKYKNYFIAIILFTIFPIERRLESPYLENKDKKNLPGNYLLKVFEKIKNGEWEEDKTDYTSLRTYFTVLLNKTLEACGRR